VERERIAASDRPFGRSDLARAAIRRPRLVLDAARSAVRGAVSGLRDDAELNWYLRSLRVRGVVPDAATGSVWFGVEQFVSVLSPHLPPDGRALELGAGAGRVSRHVAPLVGELVCTDVSRIMLDEARENLAQHGNITFLQTGGHQLLQFGDHEFDVVYSHDVFEFFDGNPALALLEEVGRVLRPAGTAVISFYALDSPVWAHEQLRIARRSAGHQSVAQVRPYAIAQMEMLFRLAGLEVVEHHTGGVIRPGGPARAEALGAMAESREALNEEGRCILVGVAGESD
jgi:SAM-dependent methyltransferase